MGVQHGWPIMQRPTRKRLLASKDLFDYELVTPIRPNWIGTKADVLSHPKWVLKALPAALGDRIALKQTRLDMAPSVHRVFW
jgi:hypothetical protein